ncbi:MAG: polyhydroxyalkanoate depolymerase, partial [Planctomycetota bacterium]
TGDDLDRGWFVANASKAIRDDPQKAIYATSFKATPLHFPCVWAPSLRTIPAVNVTNRYVARTETPEGMTDALFVVRDSDGKRVATSIQISSLAEPDRSPIRRVTNDEAFDANDHTRVTLKQNADYKVVVGEGDDKLQKQIRIGDDEQLFKFVIANEARSVEEKQRPNPSAIESLKIFLSRPRDDRGPIAKQDFASRPLTLKESQEAIDLLAEDRLKWIRKVRAEEMKQRVLVEGEYRMPFDYEIFGEKPADGRSLFISMHGGGGAPKAVNDRQWENQKRLYQPDEGVYVAPRAPTDTWNLWHQGHIDPLFVRLIENMVAFEDVRWDRVYLMGYSAGGDGVYQLAPRMADRWAAAAMMAGHPNETSPLGLRNVPFILQMGGQDSAYKRNEIAVDWKLKLADLRVNDSDGYMHLVKIYPEHGHWMNRDDAIALPWMSQFERNATPKKIVWLQDDVLHNDFYWLGVDPKEAKQGALVTATVEGQQINLKSETVKSITVYLNDEMVDLEKTVTIQVDGQSLFSGKVRRTVNHLASQLEARSDPNLCFPSAIKVAF